MSSACFHELNRDAYLFDVDGTLVDSSPVHEACFQALLAERFPDALDRFVYSAVVGWRTEDVFRTLGVTTDAAAIRGLTAAKQALYRQAVERGRVQSFPGVRDTLKLLVEERRRLYVVTGGSAVSTARVLEHTHLRDFFSGCITAADVHAGKPDPAPFLCALARFRLDPSRCLTVEDSEDGALSSERAGVAAVLVNRPETISGRIAFANFGQFKRALQKTFKDMKWNRHHPNARSAP
jgi:HAD superfamily hydrolase (TIGR01509 family)